MNKDFLIKGNLAAFSFARQKKRLHGHPLLLAMKLTLFLIMILSIKVSADIRAQDITLSYRNAPLKTVIEVLGNQGGIEFIYDERFLEMANPVTINLKNADASTALAQVFKGQPFTYEVEEGIVYIKPDQKIALPPTQLTVRGRVTDSIGNPLEGVIVEVEGVSLRTATDKQGMYVLNEVLVDGNLLFRLIGYETVKIPVNRPEINVILKMTITSINEVAVSTGYQTLPAERATGSFAKVDNELFNRQVSTDVISRLKAIAPSILFDERSGSPKLTIRGMSTIFGNADPLIVVDGFVYDGDLQNINPNDVEDIDILRDAAAASIWGVRASNGVIVISTKHGKANQPMQVEIGSNLTFVGKPDLFYQPQMSPSDMVDVEIMLFNNNHYNNDLNNNTSYPFITPVVEILAAQRSGTITEAEATSQINAYRNQNIWDDIDRHFYQTGVNQQHNLNLKGGTEKHRYYFSSGYDNNKSNWIANGFDRLTLNAQQIFNPLKNLEITTGLTYTQSKSTQNSALTGINVAKNYNARLVDEQGNHLPVGTNYRTSFVDEAESKGLLNWQFVPLDELNLQDNSVKTMENRLKGGVKYTITPGLSTEASYQYQRQNTDGRYLTKMDSYYTRDQINRFTSLTADGITHNMPLGSIVNFSHRLQQSHTGRFQLNYNQSFDKHNIAAIAGFEVRQMTIDGSSNRLYGYDELTGVSGAVNYDTGYTPYPIGFGTFIPRGDGVTGIIDRFRSWYSNVSYTYDNKYTLSGSARIDQSNLFGVDANQRSVPLWSIGGKYNIDKEDFYHWDALPSLKLRATYGYNGNLDNSITAYTTALVGNAFYTNQRQGYILTPPNANLQWERTGIFNLGIDFATKRNRISGSMDYFSKKNTDLIGETISDPTTGFATYRGNFANTKGKGLDILLNTINIQNTKFTWSTHFIYSYVVDEVYDYDIKPTVFGLYYDYSINRYAPDYTPVNDRPLFGIYSHAWAGLDPATGDPRGFLDGEPSTDYVAINSTIADDPLGMLNYHGRALPPHFGAVRNSISYRDIEISFNISYRFGYSFKRSTINYNSLFTSLSGHSDYTLRWQQPGDEMTTDVPSMIYPANATRNSFYTNSEVLVERGDHIRLQDINLSYNLRQLAILHNVLRSASVFFYGNNIGLLWSVNDKGIDPDFPTNKPIRTFALGLRANF